MKGCDVEDCTSKHWARGWCAKHYQRWKKTGDPMKAGPMTVTPHGLTTTERFWLKVDKGGPVPIERPDLGPCWQWGAGTVHGYGIFNIPATETQPKRSVNAHRWAYEQFVDPIPDGFEAEHLCHTVDLEHCDGGNTCHHRLCVNYERHIEAVSKAVNRLRGLSIPAQHARQVVCSRGHHLVDPNIEPCGNGRVRRICKACSRTHQKIRYHRRMNPDRTLNFQIESDLIYQRIMTRIPAQRIPLESHPSPALQLPNVTP